MAWKPKEKQLTPEEAVEQARKELAPFWLGTEPLLAGVRGADGKAAAHPLGKAFDEKSWLLFFADLTDFSGEVAVKQVRQWIRRYSAYELNILLVARRSYSFLNSAKDLQAMLGRSVEHFPVVLDVDGLIGEAFGVNGLPLPVLKLLHKRKVIFERSGPDRWNQGVEKELQGFLRLSDPGLPLAPPYEASATEPRDTASAELGARNRSPQLKITGKAIQEADRVLIQDPATVVRFASAHPRVSLVAQSPAQGDQYSRVRIELNGDTVYEAVVGADLAFGDDGGSEVRVGEARLYHVLQALPAGKEREITLRFPDADRLPVALYAVRFSDR
jgi:hypothetical protein